MAKGDLLDKLPVQPIDDGPPTEEVKTEPLNEAARVMADAETIHYPAGHGAQIVPAVPPADVTPLTVPPATTQLAAPARTMLTLLHDAVHDKHIDPAKMRELFELQCKIEDRQARIDFFAALQAFQAGCPDLVKGTPQMKKGKERERVTPDGRNVRNWFAKLPYIQQTIRKCLADHGFSYKWDCEPRDGNMIHCEFVLRHEAGHVERTHSDGPVDVSEYRSPAQSTGSGKTYLYRYTLIQGLGLIVGDHDNDGAGAETPTEPGPPISRDCIDTIDDLLKQKGYRTDGERDKFFTWLTKKCRTPVTSTDTIPETQYDFCIDELNRMTDAT